MICLFIPRSPRLLRFFLCFQDILMNLRNAVYWSDYPVKTRSFSHDPVEKTHTVTAHFVQIPLIVFEIPEKLSLIDTKAIKQVFILIILSRNLLNFNIYYFLWQWKCLTFMKSIEMQTIHVTLLFRKRRWFNNVLSI